MKKQTLFIFLLSIFLLSCSKDISDTPLLNDTSSKDSSQMLVFKDVDELEKAANLVLSMNTETRKVWEKQKSFSSFGIACDEVYYACIPENFKTEEDLFAFVYTNKEYLQVVTENDEKILEPINYKNKYRYLANKSKLFQVGNEVYKIFEETVIKTSTKNREILNQITESNLNTSLLSSPDILVFYSQNKQLSSSKNTCVNSDHFTNTSFLEHGFNGSKKESLHVRVTIGYIQNTGLDFLESVEYVVRPYTKVLGIWYWRKANISMDLRVRVNSYRADAGTWGYWGDSKVVSLNDERVIEGSFIFNNRQLSNTYYAPSFQALYILATNDKTDCVEKIFNY
ncbi:MAG: hypothetical protein RRY15_02550 [Bacteroidales bacterium]